MNKAKITFSNGETLVVHEEQHLIPIVRIVRDKDISASMGNQLKYGTILATD